VPAWRPPSPSAATAAPAARSAAGGARRS
ncbi:hypothetical protein PSE305_11930c, partial [Pseudomonas aeruginosa]